MKINDAFPSKYLAAADLNDKTVAVTIDSIRMEEVGEDEKPVVYFRGAKKGLVLNKTNANTIAGMHGQDTDDWPGKTIALWPTQTEFQGRAVPCIRVKLGSGGVPTTPPQTAPVAQAEAFIDNQSQDASQGVVPADDIPF